MSDTKVKGFDVQTELAADSVPYSVDNTDPLRIPFNVTRLAGGPARVEVTLVPLAGPPTVAGTPVRAEAWAPWLMLEGADARGRLELAFDDTGFRNVNAVFRLPAGSEPVLGHYPFQLQVLGVDDPDEQFHLFEPISIAVQGKQPGPAGFVAALLVILLLIIGLTVGGVLWYLSQVTLDVTLETAATTPAGRVLSNTVRIANTRGTTATQVLLEYRRPPGVLAATASVPGAPFRRCDEVDDTVWCELGDLAARSVLTVSLTTIPDPNAGVIENTGVVTVTSGEQRPSVAQPTAETTTVTPAAGVSIVLDSSQGVAAVAEPLTVHILAWQNLTGTETAVAGGLPLTVTQPLTYHVLYELPDGMRYRHDPPASACRYRTYFQLECALPAFDNGDGQIQVERLSLELVPTQVTVDAPAHRVTLLDGAGEAAAAAALPLRIVEPALLFDGIDDYAELNLTEAPESFTVSLWVQPYSLDDKQAFLGVYDVPGVDSDNENVFLVGYYEGGLHVNLMDEKTITVQGVQRTARQHVAVVVEKLAPSRSAISIYLDGVLQTENVFLA
ncbi:MAG: hypothetical protein KC425_25770, partial [Anaerolineales bacterium]|nr:hypothetical protein [Anaerolineales bacterium]